MTEKPRFELPHIIPALFLLILLGPLAAQNTVNPDRITPGYPVPSYDDAVKQVVQFEGTCIGTGMGFDPTFYYYRPTSVFAAHGYGSVLLAGSEMILLKK